jgi:UDP-glucose 4-epimerase
MDVTILDDLSSGHASFVHPDAVFIEGSILDRAVVDRALSGVTGVVHFAGYKYAGESVKRPMHTYQQNVMGTVNILEACELGGINNVVFSSSAAVYGTPNVQNVTEQTATAPESPYGETKLIGEWLLADAARAWGLRHTSLRYFNVIGSRSSHLRDTSPHNLIPLVFAALGEQRVPRINGDDYPTPDGTCVRDYVDVGDIAAAHLAAAKALQSGAELQSVYNLGAGQGTSVREILTTVAEITGVHFTPEVFPRREGDPARIVADGTEAARDLAWARTRCLVQSLEDAWKADVAAR